MALFSREGVRFFRRLGQVSLATLVLVAVATGVYWRVVRHREKAAEAAWAALDTPASRPVDRFANSLTNSTAVALQERMAPLGMDPLPVRDLEVLGRVTPWSGILADIHGYLEEQVEDPTPRLSSPPPRVSDFLRERSGDLAGLRRLLLSDLPPRWAAHSGDESLHQTIHALALTGMGEWLLCDAMDARLHGEEERSRQDLEAAWVLVEMFLERPEIISQGSAISLTRGITGVLRKVETASPAWSDRLTSIRFRTGLEASIVLWGQGYLEVSRATARQPYFGRAARRERALWKIYGRLWLRHSMASASLGIARQLEALRALGACADGYRNQTPPPSTMERRLSAMGRYGLPDYGIQWTSLMQLRAEMELTRKILSLRSLRDPDGRWPQAPAGLGASECPKVSWAYKVGEDGAMTLSLERAVPPPRRQGILDLPTTYTAPGPPRAD